MKCCKWLETSRTLWLVLLLALAVPGFSQRMPDPSRIPPYQQTQAQQAERSLEELPNIDSIEKERQLRALNAERHKSIVSDTNKLLKLARELEDEVSRTNPGSLTPDQLRKVAEIEKLARGVKDKMSTPVRGMTRAVSTFAPQNQ
jgi:hypothetical protein